MAYNQQQQPQQQQYIVAGQMLNMGDQVVQQQQYIAVDQHAMAAPIGQFETQSTPRPPVKPFDPTDHDLDANFRLTKFADLKG